MNTRFSLCVALCLLLAVMPVRAFAAELGGPAGALEVASWVKGEPVTLADLKGKKVAVIEFWATWCGPCRQSIPHLTELQKKYKDDVVFIGVSDEEEVTVKGFVEKMGDKMDYRVAVDKDQKTNAHYMQEFGINGIPHAFIVDKEGKIAFHEHPMESSFEEALAAVLKGNFDAKAMMEAAKKREENLEKANTYLHSMAAGETTPETKALGEEVLKIFAENAEVLNQFAWVMTTGDFKERDLDLALKAAETAVELTDAKNPQIIDTQARVLFEMGKKDDAIRLAKQALKLAKDEEIKTYLEEQLKVYEGGGEKPEAAPDAAPTK